MKKVLLSPPSSNPHSEHQPIYLPRKSSSISRKVSGPAVGSVGSALTQSWPHSSLCLLPKSTVAPRVYSVAHHGHFVSCTCSRRDAFPPRAHAAPGALLRSGACLCRWAPLRRLFPTQTRAGRSSGCRAVAY